MIKKKIAKFLMLMLMISGVIFSIANYVSIELRAGEGMKGIWVYNEDTGEKECMYTGNKCDIDAAMG